ncbi:DUF3040 domain-containing protein [Pseudonocardia humida]|uniref:DUF3040 domain-containing protein n=1 Tax=Pseudonocardia humida TaxID=2800819 RepID=A0ABT0ZVC7_9PSEU|nr:DUF3040 domain-containing protein [Pseudonocardia humida]MCO1654629.1 DUF3040 domain-containing protein [Pseudonocardia humida]
MLNDHERRVLRELERRTAADDPEFARTFTTRMPRAGHPAEAPAIAAVVVVFLLGVPLLLAGSVAGALAVTVTTGLIWWAWHGSSRTTDRHPRT